ncbi:MAG: hypothetical protein LBR30_07085, partial [Clostridioides sp.]|nr:hypothetical protein [Clostridioides sp.]
NDEIINQDETINNDEIINNNEIINQDEIVNVDEKIQNDATNNNEINNLNKDFVKETNINAQNVETAVTEDFSEEIIKESLLNEKEFFLIEKDNNDSNNIDKSQEQEELEFQEEDINFIKKIKLIRAKGIRAINIYTDENIEFSTYKKCARELKIPQHYIAENIMFGYTKYFGDAINYIAKSLGYADYQEENYKYLDEEKNPFEFYKELNDKIFSLKISSTKREQILENPIIEPKQMSYRFEQLDSEYDDYYNKYKTQIKRKGKKKIDLLNKKGEVVEVYKSVEDCSKALNIDYEKLISILKTGETKVGKNKIQYSFRNF